MKAGNLSGTWLVLRNACLVASPKIKCSITCDPAISLLGIYPKELKTNAQMNTCTYTFIAAVFTVASRWKCHQWMNG